MSALCSNRKSHEKMKIIKKNQMEVLGQWALHDPEMMISATWVPLPMANMATSTTEGPKANSKEQLSP